MTVKQLLEAVDTLRPNGCDSRQKAAWLSELAGRIQTEVWLRPVYETRQYAPEEDAALLPLPAAYEGLWMHWMRAQLEFADGNYPAYVAAREAFNRLCAGYQAWFWAVYAPAEHGYDPPEALGTVTYTCSGVGPLALCTLPAGALLTSVTCAVTQPFGPDSRLRLQLPGETLPPREGLDVSEAGVTVWSCALLGAPEGSVLRFCLEGAEEDGRAAFFGRILYPGKEKA